MAVAEPTRVEDAPQDDDGAAGEQPDGTDADAAGYVPMSEWLDDFDRR